MPQRTQAYITKVNKFKIDPVTLMKDPEQQRLARTTTVCKRSQEAPVNHKLETKRKWESSTIIRYILLSVWITEYSFMFLTSYIHTCMHIHIYNAYRLG